MKNWLLALGLAASVVSVSAKDMSGKFGVGGNSTLGGIQGLNIVMQPSKMLLVDATLNLGYFSPGDDNLDATTTWGVGAHAYLNFADFDNSNLYMGAGLNIGGNTADGQEGLNMSVELPLRPTYYFNDHFAIFTQTGLLINFSQQRPETPSTDSNLSIGINTNLVGGAGVNFFF